VFQRSLFPPEHGETEGLRIDARCIPCVELGGDFFDYAAAGPGQAALLIADVSGHGASAAMLTAMVKAAFRASSADGYEPLCVLERMHAGIRAFGYEKFLSAICLRISRQASRLDYANAGHPPGLVWGGARAIETLAVTGPIVSPALERAGWERASVAFGPGDGLLLFTDGVTEARGGEEFFGAERIRSVVERHPAGGRELLDRLLAALDAFTAGRPASDDVSLLVAGSS
jgi:sigma-B regulation protein RsbU (phosphoserine phosphatase)